MSSMPLNTFSSLLPTLPPPTVWSLTQDLPALSPETGITGWHSLWCFYERKVLLFYKEHSIGLYKSEGFP
jgi:hypothetical protein